MAAAVEAEVAPELEPDIDIESELAAEDLEPNLNDYDLEALE